MFQPFNDRLAIGDVADHSGLEQIAQSGYRTVIDLCTPSEGNQLNPEELKQLGMNYISLPVCVQQLSEATVESYIQTLATAQTPVYTRCASGRRAGLMTWLALATQQGWTEEKFFEQVKAAGFDCSAAPALAEFAQNYIRKLNSVCL